MNSQPFYGYGNMSYGFHGISATVMDYQWLGISINMERLREMVSEGEKRKISLINTASGRAALRGEVKKFGSIDTVRSL